MGIAKKEQKAKDKLFEITKQYYKARKILMDIRVDYYNRVQNKDISFLDKDFKETFDAAFSVCRELEHSFNTAITFMTIFGVDDVEIAQVIQQAQQEIHKKSVDKQAKE